MFSCNEAVDVHFLVIIIYDINKLVTTIVCVKCQYGVLKVIDTYVRHP